MLLGLGRMGTRDQKVKYQEASLQSSSTANSFKKGKERKPKQENTYLHLKKKRLRKIGGRRKKGIERRKKNKSAKGREMRMRKFLPYITSKIWGKKDISEGQMGDWMLWSMTK